MPECYRVRPLWLAGHPHNITNKSKHSNNNKQDKQQNKRLSRLESRLSSLSVKKSNAKRKSKKGGKRHRISKYAEPGAIVNASSLTTNAVVAQIAPFRVPRASASLLTDALPSQKISARGLMSVSVANGSALLINVCPCIANDITKVSAYALTCPTANQSDATSCFTSSTVGNVPVNCTSATAITNTPYSTATLQGEDYKWRLVSNGARLRLTTPMINRGGVLKYLVDHPFSLMEYGTINYVVLSQLISAINSSHRTVRVSLSEKPEVEIAAPNMFEAWTNVDTNGTTAARLWSGSGIANIRLGGTTSTAVGGLGPMWILMENTTGATQSFDMEIIEHWEVHGSVIEPLHTASASLHAAHELTKSIVAHAHSQHSTTPHLSFAQVVKGVAKLEHNKAAMQDVSAVAPALALLA